METYITVCKMDGQWEFAIWLKELRPGLGNNLEGWDGEGRGRDAQVGGDMGTPMADACWCLVDTNTVLWSNYPSIKNKEINNYIKWRYNDRSLEVPASNLIKTLLWLSEEK